MAPHVFNDSPSFLLFCVQYEKRPIYKKFDLVGKDIFLAPIDICRFHLANPRALSCLKHGDVVALIYHFMKNCFEQVLIYFLQAT